MSNGTIKSALARLEQAKVRAEQSVLRRERQLQKVKVKARKTMTRIKIVLGADALAMNEGRISMEEFQRRAARSGDEAREVKESLAKVGLRTRPSDTAESASIIPVLPPAPPPKIARKPKRKIVRFWGPPPPELRRKLKYDLNLTYDPETIFWCGEIDPVKVESVIRDDGHWGLVRQFHGGTSEP
jgi:hypothetical protein